MLQKLPLLEEKNAQDLVRRAEVLVLALELMLELVLVVMELACG
jgi:hypothetical protein